MGQFCFSLKDQSIPKYGKGSRRLDRKWMQIEIVQPTLLDGCQLSINYSAKGKKKQYNEQLFLEPECALSQ